MHYNRRKSVKGKNKGNIFIKIPNLIITFDRFYLIPYDQISNVYFKKVKCSKVFINKV